MPGCQRIPQSRHVELVANFETGSTGLKKGPGVGVIYRFKLRLGLFKRFIRLREYPILKPILG